MRLLRAAYVVYLICVGYLVFTPGGGTPGRAIELALDLVESVGLDISVSQLEVSLNVLLFLPLSLLGWFTLDRRRVTFWVLVAVPLSAVIELVQLAIPGRVGTVQDVVANTVGAAIGALTAMGLSAWGMRGR